MTSLNSVFPLRMTLNSHILLPCLRSRVASIISFSVSLCVFCMDYSYIIVWTVVGCIGVDFDW